MGLADGLKELLGRRLSPEDLAQAGDPRPKRSAFYRFAAVTTYDRLPDGILVRRETSVDGQPVETRVRDYTPEGLLRAERVILSTGTGLDGKFTTRYDPPGRIFGKASSVRPDGHNAEMLY